MGITESHLLSHITDSYVQIPNYTLIRNDVKGTVYKHGVCVYVHDSIKVTDVTTQVPNTVTFCVVPQMVFVVVVYRPPSNTDMNS